MGSAAVESFIESVNTKADDIKALMNPETSEGIPDMMDTMIAQMQLLTTDIPSIESLGIGQPSSKGFDDLMVGAFAGIKTQGPRSV